MSSTKMEHACNVKKEVSVLDNLAWFERNRLISHDNPQRLTYFRSYSAVRKEQLRQVKNASYVIHPYSRLRAWYEIYLIYLYGSVLITKPMDAAFVKLENCSNLSPYMFYNIFTDLLCWIDIVLNLFTGYEEGHAEIIELRPLFIVKHYLFSPYFICDALSSIPKCAIYSSTMGITTLKLGLFGTAAVLGMFKVVRIVSFVKCIWRTADYFHSTSKGLLFLICTMFGSIMIIHWLACMQFAVPRLYRINFAPTLNNNSWFYSTTIYNGTLYTRQSILTRYNHCFFKSSAYILGIRIRLYELERPEEYILAIATYFIGKVLMAFLWIILAVAILNTRIVEVKFAELINQLQEYMRQKQLPLNLQNRILQHFIFKYRNKYFKEEMIISLLSENLKKEANMHICKSLIENVALFRDLTTLEIGKVVNYLIPVIFLPNDTIIHAGTQGDAMYFISSGTVAVYTRSGKEICHLQDGAYFGEISLVIKGQLRSATIKALETSYVYRLNKKDLEKCLLTNKTVMFKILKNAEDRLKDVTKAEERFKDVLFQEELRKVAPMNK